MTLFDIKKGWYRNIEGPGLERLIGEVFGNVRREGDVYVSSYGVLSRIEVEAVDKENLRVDTENRPGDLEDGEILDTKRRLNVFLERATGFDIKARKKRVQDKAKKGLL